LWAAVQSSDPRFFIIDTKARLSCQGNPTTILSRPSPGRTKSESARSSGKPGSTLQITSTYRSSQCQTNQGRNTIQTSQKAERRRTNNGQKGDGTFRDIDFEWQPGCDEPFAIVISEVWTPPPAGLGNKFNLWAAFATVRAILICLRNTKCRRVHPLGCESTSEIKFPNGEVYARARFIFECIEI
jgi:hypothetical protein